MTGWPLWPWMILSLLRFGQIPSFGAHSGDGGDPSIFFSSGVPEQRPE